MITPDDIVNLLFSNGYYSRKYLNNLPRVAEWIRANTTCYVEQVEGDEHVVVWPTRTAYDEYMERWKVAATPPSGTSDFMGPKHLLQKELQMAIENNDFVTVSRIKQQMKDIK